MASFNKVILMGNLTRDPQLRYLPSQTPIVEFGLAANRRWKSADGQDREEVCFVDCTAFGRQAEVINQYCQRGRPLFIEGRLKFDTWEDKQGGGKRSKLSVVVENFQLLGSRQGGEGGGGDESGMINQGPPQQRRQQRGPAQQAPQQPEQPFGDEQQFKEDDIPF